MTKASVCVDVPSDIIDAQIREAVVRALGDHPEKLVKTIVDMAMDKKASSYNRQTIFQESVESMIREAGKEAFKEWLEEKKDVIKAAVASRIRSDEKFIENVAERLADGLASSFYVDVHLNVED